MATAPKAAAAKAKTEDAPEATTPAPEQDATPPAQAGKVPTITEALTAVKAEVRAVGKESRADPKLGGYAFRGVDAVVNAVAPALVRHGVVVMPQVLHIERAAAQTRSGATMLNAYVTMRYTFHGPAGDSLVAEVVGEAADAGDKAHSKAQSVAYRVALLQALTLPTDDTDPDAEGYERAGAEQQGGARGHQGQQRPQQGQQQGQGQRAPQPSISPQLQDYRDRWTAMPLPVRKIVQQLWGEAPQGTLPDGPLNVADVHLEFVNALFDEAEARAAAFAPDPSDDPWSSSNPQ